MPCARGMRRCHTDCLHRAMVCRYREIRDAGLAAIDRASSSPYRDTEEWANAREEVGEAMTFKQFLVREKREREEVYYEAAAA